VDGLWTTKIEGVRLIDRTIRFPTYVILIHQRHRQTDRQTRQTEDDMQSQYRAMH